MLESLFNKVAGLKVSNFVKKWLQHKCFPVNFREFLKTPFLTEHLRWLLLKRVCEGTSLVNLFHPVILTYLETITDRSERCPTAIVETFIDSLVDISLTFDVGFNVLIYSASLIFLSILLSQLLLRILKSSFHTWVDFFHTWVCWLFPYVSVLTFTSVF